MGVLSGPRFPPLNLQLYFMIYVSCIRKWQRHQHTKHNSPSMIEHLYWPISHIALSYFIVATGYFP